MPTLADAFGHVLNYSDHIATVHHEHGKYHVHYEYIEAAKKDSPGNAPFSNTVKKTDNSNEHLIFFTAIHISVNTPYQHHFNPPLPYFPFSYFSDNFRPPISSIV